MSVQLRLKIRNIYFHSQTYVLMCSIVLVEENGAAHIQSDALLRMGRLLGGPVGLVLFPGVLVPKV